MKKILFAAAAAVCMSVSAELKVGTVDMLKLVRNHPNYENNKQLLTSTGKDYEARVEAIRKELDAIQDEGKKLSDEYKNPMISQAAKTKLENDLMSVQSRYVAKQQALRGEMMRNEQELADLESRLLKAQAEDIRKRVSRFAEANGYDFVFDVAATVFAKKTYDVTDEILKDMGVKPEAAKDGNEGK